MKTHFRPPKMVITSVIALATAQYSYSSTLYVDATSTNPSQPYSSWGTAATTIQDAVNAAGSGDIVLVAGGTYATGSAPTPGASIASRLVITKNITVKSVAGAKVTVIQGAADPGSASGLGAGAIRCVYMDTGILEGFTLENGHTTAGSGGPSDKDLGGGGAVLDQGGVITNCILTGNRADYQGGAALLIGGGHIVDSEITGNQVERFGGGACLYSGGIIEGCTITSNSAINNYGGGIICNWSGGIVRDCMISDNTAKLGGGGIYFVNGLSKIYNSKIVNNSAGFAGGICFRNYGEAHSCLIANNSATGSGGGVSFYYGGRLYNSTVADNVSPQTSKGGGIWISRGAYIHNGIVWGNTGQNEVEIYDDGSYVISIRNTCANEGVVNGINGCITANPYFVDSTNGIYRLSASSPCIDSGNNTYKTTSTDVEGQPRQLDGNADELSHIDIGAFEFMSDSVDTDADGMSDWKEYIADTDATDSNAFFKIENIANINGDTSVSFYASRRRQYTVQFCEDMSAGGWEDLPGLTQLSGLEGLCQLTDTNTINDTGFYTVKVALP